MHSLNQVNKLVSCGRDPARSLPLWRGFLHPAHSGVLCICAANASSHSGARRILPRVQHGRRTAGTAVPHLRYWKYSAWLACVFSNDAASFNTGVGAGALVLNFNGEENTAVGTVSQLLNSAGSRNTSVGTATLLVNAGDADGNGSFNGAYGAFSLRNNDDGFSNNAVGDSTLFRNIHGAANTAVGDLALEDNDATGNGDAQ